ncbi:MAG: hypothetical protein V7K40_21420 [Nostoc sp.]|uniref:hypothetical protein n=1 Tax=Nostoc sp. TaxID=1180 RepID=UPI002FF50462
MVKQGGESGANSGFPDLSLARLPLGEATGVSEYCAYSPSPKKDALTFGHTTAGASLWQCEKGSHSLRGVSPSRGASRVVRQSGLGGFPQEELPKGSGDLSGLASSGVRRCSRSLVSESDALYETLGYPCVRD